MPFGMQTSARRGLSLLLVLCAATATVEAQFDKLRKRIPGIGGGSEVDALVSQMGTIRVKSAYARVSLSLADDLIRRQALRNSTRKTAEGQIAKDEQEVKALDQSIAEKRRLLAELGRQTGGGKYDEETAAKVDGQLKAEEQQQAEKRALVDQEIADQERREKEMSPQDRENYAKLAKILYGASKQEKEAIETAQDVKPRAESAAANTKRSPLGLASTQPTRLNDGLKGVGEVLAEGPQHLVTLTSVAQHFAKIGGVDLTDPKFQATVVTDEDEVPTDW